MPYKHEKANKISHLPMMSDPSITDVLSDLRFNAHSVVDMTAGFVNPPEGSEGHLPPRTIAIDGSSVLAEVEGKSNCVVGFVRVGEVTIDTDLYQQARDKYGLCNPYETLQLTPKISSKTYVIPTANTLSIGLNTVAHSFRYQINNQMDAPNTRFDAADPDTSLLSTFMILVGVKGGDLFAPLPLVLILKICPTCGKGPVEIRTRVSNNSCDNCGEPVYPADLLMLSQEVDETAPSEQAVNRFMTVAEKLLLVHRIRALLKNNAAAKLSATTFVLDGPLALFGGPHWIHAPIMEALAWTNTYLATLGLPAPLIIGVQKTGVLVDYSGRISPQVSEDQVLLVSDEYRYQFIQTIGLKRDRGFGYSSHFGQDFCYKTPTGQMYCFSLVFPWASKTPADEFIKKKSDISQYSQLATALKFINFYRSDSYENALVPVVAANQHVSISAGPGAKALAKLASNTF